MMSATPTHEVSNMARRAPRRPGSGSYWVKSSFSYSNGNCVEVASLYGLAVGVRDSRDADGVILRFATREWHAFLGGVRNGEFDGPGRAAR
jgi:hypothetical protein